MEEAPAKDDGQDGNGPERQSVGGRFGGTEMQEHLARMGKQLEDLEAQHQQMFGGSQGPDRENLARATARYWMQHPTRHGSFLDVSASQETLSALKMLHRSPSSPSAAGLRLSTDATSLRQSRVTLDVLTTPPHQQIQQVQAIHSTFRIRSPTADEVIALARSRSGLITRASVPNSSTGSRPGTPGAAPQSADAARRGSQSATPSPRASAGPAQRQRSRTREHTPQRTASNSLDLSHTQQPAAASAAGQSVSHSSVSASVGTSMAGHDGLEPLPSLVISGTGPVTQTRSEPHTPRSTSDSVRTSLALGSKRQSTVYRSDLTPDSSEVRVYKYARSARGNFMHEDEDSDAASDASAANPAPAAAASRSVGSSGQDTVSASSLAGGIGLAPEPSFNGSLLLAGLRVSSSGERSGRGACVGGSQGLTFDTSPAGPEGRAVASPQQFRSPPSRGSARSTTGDAAGTGEGDSGGNTGTGVSPESPREAAAGASSPLPTTPSPTHPPGSPFDADSVLMGSPLPNALRAAAVAAAGGMAGAGAVSPGDGTGANTPKSAAGGGGGTAEPSPGGLTPGQPRPFIAEPRVLVYEPSRYTGDEDDYADVPSDPITQSATHGGSYSPQPATVAAPGAATGAMAGAPVPVRWVVGQGPAEGQGMFGSGHRNMGTPVDGWQGAASSALPFSPAPSVQPARASAILRVAADLSPSAHGSPSFAAPSDASIPPTPATGLPVDSKLHSVSTASGTPVAAQAGAAAAPPAGGDAGGPGLLARIAAAAREGGPGHVADLLVNLAVTHDDIQAAIAVEMAKRSAIEAHLSQLNTAAAMLQSRGVAVLTAAGEMVEMAEQQTQAGAAATVSYAPDATDSTAPTQHATQTGVPAASPEAHTSPAPSTVPSSNGAQQPGVSPNVASHGGAAEKLQALRRRRQESLSTGVSRVGVSMSAPVSPAMAGADAGQAAGLGPFATAAGAGETGQHAAQGASYGGRAASVHGASEQGLHGNATGTSAATTPLGQGSVKTASRSASHSGTPASDARHGRHAGPGGGGGALVDGGRRSRRTSHDVHHTGGGSGGGGFSPLTLELPGAGVPTSSIAAAMQRRRRSTTNSDTPSLSGRFSSSPGTQAFTLSDTTHTITAQSHSQVQVQGHEDETEVTSRAEPSFSDVTAQQPHWPSQQPQPQQPHTAATAQGQGVSGGSGLVMLQAWDVYQRHVRVAGEGPPPPQAAGHARVAGDAWAPAASLRLPSESMDLGHGAAGVGSALSPGQLAAMGSAIALPQLPPDPAHSPHPAALLLAGGAHPAHASASLTQLVHVSGGSYTAHSPPDVSTTSAVTRNRGTSSLVVSQSHQEASLTTSVESARSRPLVSSPAAHTHTSPPHRLAPDDIPIISAAWAVEPTHKDTPSHPNLTRHSLSRTHRSTPPAARDRAARHTDQQATPPHRAPAAAAKDTQPPAPPPEAAAARPAARSALQRLKLKCLQRHTLTASYASTSAYPDTSPLRGVDQDHSAARHAPASMAGGASDSAAGHESSSPGQDYPEHGNVTPAPTLRGVRGGGGGGAGMGYNVRPPMASVAQSAATTTAVLGDINNDESSVTSTTPKPFLKRRSQRIQPAKVDWSHVKPRTVCRMSDYIPPSAGYKAQQHTRGATRRAARSNGGGAPQASMGSPARPASRGQARARTSDAPTRGAGASRLPPAPFHMEFDDWSPVKRSAAPENAHPGHPYMSAVPDPPAGLQPTQWHGGERAFASPSQHRAAGWAPGGVGSPGQANTQASPSSPLDDLLKHVNHLLQDFDRKFGPHT